MRHAVLLLSFLLMGCGARSELDEGEWTYWTEDVDVDVDLSPGTIVTFGWEGEEGRRDRQQLIRMDDLDGSGYAESRLGGAIRQYAAEATFDRRGRLHFLEGTSPDDVRLVRLDADTGQMAWSETSDELPLSSVSGLAIDTRGHVYLSDADHHRILRLDDLSGAGLVELGVGPGSGKGAFNGPTGIDVSSDGRIAVADRNNGRVVVVDDIDGAGWTTCQLSEVDYLGGPILPEVADVAFGRDGEVYAVTFNPFYLVRCRDGQPEIIEIVGQPSSIDVAADGRIFIGFLNGVNALGSLSQFDVPFTSDLYGGPVDDPFSIQTASPSGPDCALKRPPRAHRNPVGGAS